MLVACRWEPGSSLPVEDSVRGSYLGAFAESNTIGLESKDVREIVKAVGGELAEIDFDTQSMFTSL